MTKREPPKPEAGIRLYAFAEQANAMIFASEACARAFGFSSPRVFASWVRQHLEKYAAAYDRQLPANTKVFRITFNTVDLVLIHQTIEVGGGHLPVDVIAAVLPSEQEAGERSLGSLRRYLKQLAVEQIRKTRESPANPKATKAGAR